MENISKIKESCVGCKSCEQSCPKHCISMVENKEGFWYPTVDENSCIECKVCLKKCPVENTEFHRNKPHKVWAWRNKNDVDVMRSASGGAADSAAKTILQTVFKCVCGKRVLFCMEIYAVFDSRMRIFDNG